MNINEYYQVTVSENEAFESLYSGKIKNLESVFIDNYDLINQFNRAKTTNADNFKKLQQLDNPNCTPEEFHKRNQLNWFMPQDYCPDLIEQIYSKCETDIQTQRVNQELELFAQHNMLDLLFYLKYLVDTMRKNNILWGVGRGSSVASYVLFLIGVHKIDSIKYNLDIKEFLK